MSTQTILICIASTLILKLIIYYTIKSNKNWKIYYQLEKRSRRNKKEIEELLNDIFVFMTKKSTGIILKDRLLNLYYRVMDELITLK